MENLFGENASGSFSRPPTRISAAKAPTAALVVTPCPPSPATQKKFLIFGSQPITKRPSPLRVLKPAQRLLMATLQSPECSAEFFPPATPVPIRPPEDHPATVPPDRKRIEAIPVLQAGNRC